MPVSKSVSARDFCKWIDRYNAASLSENALPNSNILTYANQCNAIICSDLQKSIDSAAVLDSNKAILSNQLFSEAGLPSADWKTIKLPPKFWAAVFRIMWLFGYSNNSESFTQTKARASRASKKLIALAEEHQKVLLVGHGIFNHPVAKELKKNGWSGPRNPGSKYWSFGVYKFSGSTS